MLQAGEPIDSLEASNSNASLQELIMTAMNIRASYYTMVAGFVIYIWDILLTLKDEQELLWTKHGRFVKILYLVVSLVPSRNNSMLNGLIESLYAICWTTFHHLWCVSTLGMLCGMTDVLLSSQ
jgi:hypothetical protein